MRYEHPNSEIMSKYNGIVENDWFLDRSGLYRFFQPAKINRNKSFPIKDLSEISSKPELPKCFQAWRQYSILFHSLIQFL
ncbi:MAG TPA: hypothetical protein DCE41_02285 [Cytophagales bacterium]|nr:hypothetical protein [Cytophagales bacterium]HAA21914.1 hypothetical protein [Cytophagales bacterium]HAP63814.1 hypothetical protein [Cytophagales bacterium]